MGSCDSGSPGPTVWNGRRSLALSQEQTSYPRLRGLLPPEPAVTPVVLSQPWIGGPSGPPCRNVPLRQDHLSGPVPSLKTDNRRQCLESRNQYLPVHAGVIARSLWEVRGSPNDKLGTPSDQAHDSRARPARIGISGDRHHCSDDNLAHVANRPVEPWTRRSPLRQRGPRAIWGLSYLTLSCGQPKR